MSKLLDELATHLAERQQPCPPMDELYTIVHERIKQIHKDSVKSWLDRNNSCAALYKLRDEILDTMMPQLGAAIDDLDVNVQEVIHDEVMEAILETPVEAPVEVKEEMKEAEKVVKKYVRPRNKKARSKN